MADIKRKLKATGLQAKELASSISSISQGSQITPGGIKYLMERLCDKDISDIKTELGLTVEYNWQCFYTDNGVLVSYKKNEFSVFVGTPPPNGLGTTPQRLLNISKVYEDKTLRSAIIDVYPEMAEKGVNQYSGCVNNTPKRGTSNHAYIISRLQRDHKDLLQMVKNGEITTHQAAIKSGIRKRYISVKYDTSGFIKKIKQVFSKEEIDEIINGLNRLDFDAFTPPASEPTRPGANTGSCKP